MPNGSYKEENETLLIQVEDFWHSGCSLDTSKNLQIEDLQSTSVLITKNVNGATGQLIYNDGKIVTMNLIRNGCPGFAIAAVGEKGFLHEKIDFDENMYLEAVA